MKKIGRFAAIDMGSNAIRLLLSTVYRDDQRYHLNKDCMLRYPLRLGDEVFQEGAITRSSGETLIKVFEAFRKLLDAYEPIAFRACATSVMREADNAVHWKKAIKQAARIDLTVITGQEEAKILYDTHVDRELDPEKSYLYIDVGGGSTELTVIQHGEHKTSVSLDMGALRLWRGRVKAEEWKRLKSWIRENAIGKEKLVCLGSGGNIQTAIKIVGEKKAKYTASLKKLKAFYEELKPLSLEEKMVRWRLRTDRAEVIVPALQIYTTVMEEAGSKKIYVPSIGVADGLIAMLAEAHVKNAGSTPGNAKAYVGSTPDNDGIGPP